MSKRIRLTLGEKRQICVFSEENPMTTHKSIADIFTAKLGKSIARSTTVGNFTKILTYIDFFVFLLNQNKTCSTRSGLTMESRLYLQSRTEKLN